MVIWPDGFCDALVARGLDVIRFDNRDSEPWRSSTPSRMLSLTSMMSTTGDMTVGRPDPDTAKAIVGGPPAVTRVDLIAQAVRSVSLVGSPRFPTDETEVTDRAAERSTTPTTRRRSRARRSQPLRPEIASNRFAGSACRRS